MCTLVYGSPQSVRLPVTLLWRGPNLGYLPRTLDQTRLFRQPSKEPPPKQKTDFTTLGNCSFLN